MLPTLPAGHFHTCVTSPPYFGLRDYGVDGQLGLEPTPDEYVAELVKVFREVRRALRDDGTVWLNLGSSYASGGMKTSQSRQPSRAPACDTDGREQPDSLVTDCVCPDPDCSGQCGVCWAYLTIPSLGIKAKDLIMMPHLVALALQADGWWLRQEIICDDLKRGRAALAELTDRFVERLRAVAEVARTTGGEGDTPRDA